MPGKKSGLGKGLDSLIPNKKNDISDSKVEKKQEKENDSPKSGEIMVRINEVEPNRDQPRKDFDEDALMELADSIRQFGILQPLLVQKKKNYYEIIAGERRWRAAKLAGIKEVPIIVKDYTDQEIVEISLIENIQRENLNPIEEAMAFKRLLQEFQLKQDEVAERVSKSRTAVTNSMRLLKLSPRVQQMIIDDMISTGHARALLAIDDEEQQFILANKIFDEMIDFAKYAFNKSHAAAYAVVSYQTAWLRCYYPVEFMAALLTSVITNPKKITEYINTCRVMGISILPPDINEGEAGFSVASDSIRYGLAAIKSLGKSVIDVMTQERNENGKYKDLKDFMERLTSKEINKRTIENLIKSGALDSFGKTRKQQMLVYPVVLEEVNRERKESISGQMSLFDFFSEEEKKEYEMQYPDVGEYDDAQKLALEKEVLGIYVSGHPLQKYMDSLEKQTTAKSTDFEPDEESGRAVVRDGQHYVVGGLISNVTAKLTKNNQNMAFVTLEDLYGTVEIIVFPTIYQNVKPYLIEDQGIYVKGRASVSEESGKLIAEYIVPIEQIPKEVWIQTENIEEFTEKQQKLYGIIRKHPGKDEIVIFSKKEKAIKRLPSYENISAKNDVFSELKSLFGEKNVKVREKSIEKSEKKR